MTNTAKYLSRTAVDAYDVFLAKDILSTEGAVKTSVAWANHTLSLPLKGTDIQQSERNTERTQGTGSNKTSSTPAKPEITATEKQLYWIKKIGGEKDLTGLTILHITKTITVEDVVARAEAGALVTKGEAGKVLDIFFDKSNPLPNKVIAPVEEIKVQKPAKKVITEDGMYKLGDRIIKVQKAVHGSGKLYAKELVQVDGPEDENDTTPVKFAFEYAPGVVNQLTADDKMTKDEAKAFGQLYGVCCNCNRTLTDEKSIAEGIGPICAQSF